LRNESGKYDYIPNQSSFWQNEPKSFFLNKGAGPERLEDGFGAHVSDEESIEMQKTLQRTGISFINENGGAATSPA
jgi:hypothetical protein